MKTSPVRNLLLSSALLFTASTTSAASFGKDITFLKKHTEVIVLRDKAGSAQVALAPACPRARVARPCHDKHRWWEQRHGRHGFGWINRKLIASRKIQPHINVFGGEDRFWLGPEGGQFF